MHRSNIKPATGGGGQVALKAPHHRQMLLVAAAGLLVLAALAWFAFSQREASRRIVYVIPAGTAAGRVSADFPAEITLTLGHKDTLVIDNQDDVVHTFGPFVIAPRSTLTKRFTRPLVYEGACTFHQEQQMRLVVKPGAW